MPLEVIDDPEYDEFRAAQLSVLTSLDVDEFRAYIAKYSPDVDRIVGPMSDTQVLRSMHLARLGADFMDDEAKRVSAEWLRQRGYRGWEGFEG